MQIDYIFKVLVSFGLISWDLKDNSYYINSNITD